MSKEHKTSVLSSSFDKKSKFVTVLVTLTAFIATTLWTPGLYAATAVSEVPLPYQFKLDSNLRFNVPQELGKIEALHFGKSGQPTVIHIQDAHGHYQAQQKIRQILRHLSKNYGIKTVLVEGSAFKLEPEVLNFFPKDHKLTMKVNDELTKHALVKGPELFLLDQIGNQGTKNVSRAYGIEDVTKYRENGYAFVDVLDQKEKTQGFLADMNEGIERLSAPYLNDTLRTFLKREEAFEKNLMPLDAWLSYLRGQAQKNLKFDPADVAAQVEWPMLTRIFKIQELSSRLDKKAFPKEKDKFLKALKRFLPESGKLEKAGNPLSQIEELFKSETQSVQLPDPETSLLFEDMVKRLPKDFNYDAFPNIRYFIGTLLLQSELKAPMLMEEVRKLADRIANKLAKAEVEKDLIGLLKDYRLLQKLFVLGLTPDDYETILGKQGAGNAEQKNILPSAVVHRFGKIVSHASSSEPRVRAVKFEHVEELDGLYGKAMKFYKGVKARDGAMEAMIEKRLKETGDDKVAVITGGFHSEPFKNYFSTKDYTYALISPKLGGADKNGYQEYIRHTIEQSLKKATRASLYAMSIQHAKVQGVSATAMARDMFRAGRRDIPKGQVQSYLLHLKRLAGVAEPAPVRAEMRSAPIGFRLLEPVDKDLIEITPSFEAFEVGGSVLFDGTAYKITKIIEWIFLLAPFKDGLQIDDKKVFMKSRQNLNGAFYKAPTHVGVGMGVLRSARENILMVISIGDKSFVFDAHKNPNVIDAYYDSPRYNQGSLKSNLLHQWQYVLNWDYFVLAQAARILFQIPARKEAPIDGLKAEFMKGTSRIKRWGMKAVGHEFDPETLVRITRKDSDYMSDFYVPQGLGGDNDFIIEKIDHLVVYRNAVGRRALVAFSSKNRHWRAFYEDSLLKGKFDELITVMKTDGESCSIISSDGRGVRSELRMQEIREWLEGLDGTELQNALVSVMAAKMNQNNGRVDQKFSELVGTFNQNSSFTQDQKAEALALLRSNSDIIPQEILPEKSAPLPYADWAREPMPSVDRSETRSTSLAADEETGNIRLDLLIRRIKNENQRYQTDEVMDAIQEIPAAVSPKEIDLVIKLLSGEKGLGNHNKSVADKAASALSEVKQKALAGQGVFIEPYRKEDGWKFIGNASGKINPEGHYQLVVRFAAQENANVLSLKWLGVKSSYRNVLVVRNSSKAWRAPDADILKMTKADDVNSEILRLLKKEENQRGYRGHVHGVTEERYHFAGGETVKTVGKDDQSDSELTRYLVRLVIDLAAKKLLTPTAPAKKPVAQAIEKLDILSKDADSQGFTDLARDIRMLRDDVSGGGLTGASLEKFGSNFDMLQTVFRILRENNPSDAFLLTMQRQLLLAASSIFEGAPRSEVRLKDVVTGMLAVSAKAVVRTIRSTLGGIDAGANQSLVDQLASSAVVQRAFQYYADTSMPDQRGGALEKVADAVVSTAGAAVLSQKDFYAIEDRVIKPLIMRLGLGERIIWTEQIGAITAKVGVMAALRSETRSQLEPTKDSNGLNLYFNGRLVAIGKSEFFKDVKTLPNKRAALFVLDYLRATSKNLAEIKPPSSDSIRVHFKNNNIFLTVTTPATEGRSERFVKTAVLTAGLLQFLGGVTILGAFIAFNDHPFTFWAPVAIFLAGSISLVAGCVLGDKAGTLLRNSLEITQGEIRSVVSGGLGVPDSLMNAAKKTRAEIRKKDGASFLTPEAMFRLLTTSQHARAALLSAEGKGYLTNMDFGKIILEVPELKIFAHQISYENIKQLEDFGFLEIWQGERFKPDSKPPFPILAGDEQSPFFVSLTEKGRSEFARSKERSELRIGSGEAVVRAEAPLTAREDAVKRSFQEEVWPMGDKNGTPRRRNVFSLSQPASVAGNLPVLTGPLGILYTALQNPSALQYRSEVRLTNAQEKQFQKAMSDLRPKTLSSVLRRSRIAMKLMLAAMVGFYSVFTQAEVPERSRQNTELSQTAAASNWMPAPSNPNYEIGFKTEGSETVMMVKPRGGAAIDIMSIPDTWSFQSVADISPDATTLFWGVKDAEGVYITHIINTSGQAYEFRDLMLRYLSFNETIATAAVQINGVLRTLKFDIHSLEVFSNTPEGWMITPSNPDFIIGTILVPGNPNAVSAVLFQRSTGWLYELGQMPSSWSLQGISDLYITGEIAAAVLGVRDANGVNTTFAVNASGALSFNGFIRSAISFDGQKIVSIPVRQDSGVTKTIKIDLKTMQFAEDPLPGPSEIRIIPGDRRLFVRDRLPDGSLSAEYAFIGKGVNWSPHTKGASEANLHLEFKNWYQIDIPLMAQMGVTVVRVYHDFGTGADARNILDTFHHYGIKVIVEVDSPRHGVVADLNNVRNVVNAYKNHPAILMWAVGNEWDINKYYGRFSTMQEAAQFTEQAARLIKTLDSGHPVATVIADPHIPGTHALSQEIFPYLDDAPYTKDIVNTWVPSVDAWILNIYRNSSFMDFFQQWRSISSKPMMVGEFGADSYDSRVTSENQLMQSGFNAGLWDELYFDLSAQRTNGVAIGGFLFEWNDEWWKNGDPSSHNISSENNPGQPDGYNDEEFFGLVTIDRQPKLVCTGIQKRFLGGSSDVAVNASPLITATSSGFAEFKIEDKVLFNRYGRQHGARGINIAVLDLKSGIRMTEIRSFDTWAPSGAAQEMIQFIDSLPSGSILALAIADEGTQSLTTAGRQALINLGSTKIGGVTYQGHWAMIVVKGGAVLAEGISNIGPVTVQAEAFLTPDPMPDRQVSSSPDLQDVGSDKAAVRSETRNVNETVLRERLKSIRLDREAVEDVARLAKERRKPVDIAEIIESKYGLSNKNMLVRQLILALPGSRADLEKGGGRKTTGEDPVSWGSSISEPEQPKTAPVEVWPMGDKNGTPRRRNVFSLSQPVSVAGNLPVLTGPLGILYTALQNPSALPYRSEVRLTNAQEKQFQKAMSDFRPKTLSSVLRRSRIAMKLMLAAVVGMLASSTSAAVTNAVATGFQGRVGFFEGAEQFFVPWSTVTSGIFLAVGLFSVIMQTRSMLKFQSKKGDYSEYLEAGKKKGLSHDQMIITFSKVPSILLGMSFVDFQGVFSGRVGLGAAAISFIVMTALFSMILKIVDMTRIKSANSAKNAQEKKTDDSEQGPSSRSEVRAQEWVKTALIAVMAGAVVALAGCEMGGGSSEASYSQEEVAAGATDVESYIDAAIGGQEPVETFIRRYVNLVLDAEVVSPADLHGFSPYFTPGSGQMNAAPDHEVFEIHYERMISELAVIETRWDASLTYEQNFANKAWIKPRELGSRSEVRDVDLEKFTDELLEEMNMSAEDLVPEFINAAMFTDLAPETQKAIKTVWSSFGADPNSAPDFFDLNSAEIIYILQGRSEVRNKESVTSSEYLFLAGLSLGVTIVLFWAVGLGGGVEESLRVLFIKKEILPLWAVIGSALTTVVLGLAGWRAERVLRNRRTVQPTKGISAKTKNTTGSRSEVREAVKVLFADKPENEKTISTAGAIENIKLVGDAGIGKDEAALQKAIETDRPEVVIVRSGTAAFKKSDFIKMAARNGVRAIVRMGAGVDNVDLKAAKEAGISVIRTHGNANSVANLTLRLLLAAADRRFPGEIPSVDAVDAQALNIALDVPSAQFMKAIASSEKKGRGTIDRSLAADIFVDRTPLQTAASFTMIRDATIGLAGFGPIAQSVAQKLQSISEAIRSPFPVMALSRSLLRGDPEVTAKADELGVLHPDEEQFLSQVRILSLHLPGPKKGEAPFLTLEKLRRASHLKVIINTSRQSVIAPEALDEFLKNPGHLYFADVDLAKAGKTLPEIESFLKYPNAIFIPHIGASTEDAAEGVEAMTVPTLEGTIQRILGLESKIPIDVVNGVMPAARAEAQGKGLEGPEQTIPGSDASWEELAAYGNWSGSPGGHHPSRSEARSIDVKRFVYELLKISEIYYGKDYWIEAFGPDGSISDLSSAAQGYLKEVLGALGIEKGLEDLDEIDLELRLDKFFAENKSAIHAELTSRSETRELVSIEKAVETWKDWTKVSDAVDPIRSPKETYAILEKIVGDNALRIYSGKEHGSWGIQLWKNTDVGRYDVNTLFSMRWFGPHNQWILGAEAAVMKSERSPEVKLFFDDAKAVLYVIFSADQDVADLRELGGEDTSEVRVLTEAQFKAIFRDGKSETVRVPLSAAMSPAENQIAINRARVRNAQTDKLLKDIRKELSSRFLNDIDLFTRLDLLIYFESGKASYAANANLSTVLTAILEYGAQYPGSVKHRTDSVFVEFKNVRNSVDAPDDAEVGKVIAGLDKVFNRHEVNVFRNQKAVLELAKGFDQSKMSTPSVRQEIFDLVLGIKTASTETDLEAVLKSAREFLRIHPAPVETAKRNEIRPLKDPSELTPLRLFKIWELNNTVTGTAKNDEKINALRELGKVAREYNLAAASEGSPLKQLFKNFALVLFRETGKAVRMAAAEEFVEAMRAGNFKESGDSLVQSILAIEKENDVREILSPALEEFAYRAPRVPSIPVETVKRAETRALKSPSKLAFLRLYEIRSVIDGILGTVDDDNKKMAALRKFGEFIREYNIAAARGNSPLKYLCRGFETIMFEGPSKALRVAAAEELSQAMMVGNFRESRDELVQDILTRKVDDDIKVIFLPVIEELKIEKLRWEIWNLASKFLDLNALDISPDMYKKKHSTFLEMEWSPLAHRSDYESEEIVREIDSLFQNAELPKAELGEKAEFLKRIGGLINQLTLRSQKPVEASAPAPETATEVLPAAQPATRSEVTAEVPPAVQSNLGKKSDTAKIELPPARTSKLRLLAGSMLSLGAVGGFMVSFVPEYGAIGLAISGFCVLGLGFLFERRLKITRAASKQTPAAAAKQTSQKRSEIRSVTHLVKHLEIKNPRHEQLELKAKDGLKLLERLLPEGTEADIYLALNREQLKAPSLSERVRMHDGKLEVKWEEKSAWESLQPTEDHSFIVGQDGKIIHFYKLQAQGIPVEKYLKIAGGAIRARLDQILRFQQHDLTVAQERDIVNALEFTDPDPNNPYKRETVLAHLKEGLELIRKFDGTQKRSELRGKESLALAEKILKKTPPSRRGGITNAADIPDGILTEVKEVIQTFQKMLTMPGNTPPSEEEILDAMVDSNVLHPYKIANKLPAQIVFDGRIFKDYPGTKPYRISVTVGEDVLVANVTHTVDADFRKFDFWTHARNLTHPLSAGFNLEKFMVGKGGSRYYQEGVGELETFTLAQKISGAEGTNRKGNKVKTKHWLVENSDLSRGMDDKSPPADVPWWGGKSVVVVRKGADKKKAFERWVAASICAGFLGQLYLAGPDMGTADMMKVIQDTADKVHRDLGMPLARVTTSIIGEDGSFRHQDWTVTSITGMEAFLEAIRNKELMQQFGADPSGPIDIVIQGFGDVGAGYIRYLMKQYPELLRSGRIRIVGISNINGGIFDPNGIDPEELIRLNDIDLNINLFENYGNGKAALRKNLRQVKSGNDIYYVRTLFPDAENSDKPIVGFPAANPNVVTSKADIEKLVTAKVKMLIASANNFLKEDEGLDVLLENAGILFFDAPFVSSGGINTSGEEMSHIYAEGIENVRKIKTEDPDYYRIHVQDGITNLIISLTRWLVNEYNRRGKHDSVTKIHQDLARQIREQKAQLLKDPPAGFVKRVERELNRVWGLRYEEVKNNSALWDEIALIVILTISTEYAREQAMYADDDVPRMLRDMDSENPLVQRIAIYELGRRRHYGIEQKLMDILLDPHRNDLVRAAAAEALVHLHYQDAVLSLERIVQEIGRGPDVPEGKIHFRVHAQWALNKMRKESVPNRSEVRTGDALVKRIEGLPEAIRATLNDKKFDPVVDPSKALGIIGGLKGDALKAKDLKLFEQLREIEIDPLEQLVRKVVSMAAGRNAQAAAAQYAAFVGFGALSVKSRSETRMLPELAEHAGTGLENDVFAKIIYGLKERSEPVNQQKIPAGELIPKLMNHVKLVLGKMEEILAPRSSIPAAALAQFFYAISISAPVGASTETQKGVSIVNQQRITYASTLSVDARAKFVQMFARELKALIGISARLFKDEKVKNAIISDLYGAKAPALETIQPEVIVLADLLKNMTPLSETSQRTPDQFIEEAQKLLAVIRRTEKTEKTENTENTNNGFKVKPPFPSKTVNPLPMLQRRSVPRSETRSLQTVLVLEGTKNDLIKRLREEFPNAKIRKNLTVADVRKIIAKEGPAVQAIVGEALGYDVNANALRFGLKNVSKLMKDLEALELKNVRLFFMANSIFPDVSPEETSVLERDTQSSINVTDAMSVSDKNDAGTAIFLKDLRELDNSLRGRSEVRVEGLNFKVVVSDKKIRTSGMITIRNGETSIGRFFIPVTDLNRVGEKRYSIDLLTPEGTFFGNAIQFDIGTDEKGLLKSVGNFRRGKDWEEKDIKDNPIRRDLIGRFEKVASALKIFFGSKIGQHWDADFFRLQPARVQVSSDGRSAPAGALQIASRKPLAMTPAQSDSGSSMTAQSVRIDQQRLRSETRGTIVSENNTIDEVLTPERIELVEQFYFKILPMWLYSKIFSGRGFDGVSQTLRQVFGVPMVYAAENAEQPSVFDKYFAPESQLIVSQNMAEIFTYNGSKPQTATRASGPVYVGQGLMGRLILDNPRALFYLLKFFHNLGVQAGRPLLETLTPREQFIRSVKEALNRKGVVDPVEFEMLQQVITALEQGEILKFIEPNGKSEAVLINERIAANHGNMATLLDNPDILPMLEGGVNVVFGKQINERDLIVVVPLILRLWMVTGLKGDALLKAMSMLLPGYKKSGLYGFILERIDGLVQEFVSLKLFKKSA